MTSCKCCSYITAIDLCEEDYFRCPDGSGSCYPFSFICDDYPDCDDGSDEQYCDTCEMSHSHSGITKVKLYSLGITQMSSPVLVNFLWRRGKYRASMSVYLSLRMSKA